MGKLDADIKALVEHRTFRRERSVGALAADSSAGVPESKTEVDDNDASFIERFREEIDKNLMTESYTIDKLCTALGISRTSLYLKVKKVTNDAPSDYIFHYKMEKAKDLLITRQFNVTEVANMLGFCDAKYFRKRFKQFYKVPPSRFVKSIAK